MNKNSPLVYIIIVNWNGIDDTVECLESLQKIKYENYKIVLIDNNSKDNQAGKLKKQFPYVKLIQNSENTGFCIANNQGIELALREKADYVLLLNNDTTVTSDFLDILIDYSEKHPKVGIVSPKINYFYDPSIVWCIGGSISIFTGLNFLIGKGKKSSQYNKMIEPNFVSGCALLTKKEVIKKIGMLDPVYFAYNEDTDFSYRVRRAGYKIIVLPKSVILHKKSASAGFRGLNKLSKLQIFLQTRNQIIFCKKNSLKHYIPLYLIFRFIYFFYNLRNFSFVTSFHNGIRDGLKYKY